MQWNILNLCLDIGTWPHMRHNSRDTRWHIGTIVTLHETTWRGETWLPVSLPIM